MSNEELIKDILKSFEKYDGIYKRQEMEDAVNLKQEITPHLLAILDKVIAEPKKCLENDYYSHLYALTLLVHFKEPKAHEKIVKIALLEDKLPDDILGDTITEGLDDYLYCTCDGNVQSIIAIILNKEAYEYSRTSAMSALNLCVAANYISREKVLEFYSGLFTGKESDFQSYFWSSLGSSICELAPEKKHLNIIKQAFADDLIDRWFLDEEDIEKVSNISPEEALVKIKQRSRETNGIHDWMSWWACFDKEKKTKSKIKPNLKSLSLYNKKEKIIPKSNLSRNQKKRLRKKKKK